jgi:hypothetical protein
MAISASATQEFVPIQEVRDGIIVMRDGTVRAILLASSINFDLKSADEQRSILMQFQNFLNSLDFSIQIFVQSRRLDIRPYIALLEDRQKDQTNDLMRIQVKEYIEFVKKFTESTNIMTKNFFIVVSYAPSVIDTSKKGSILGSLFGKKGSVKTVENTQFEETRSQLEERMAVVEQGLVRTGVRMARLGTEEVVELFYKIFNPGETEKPMMPTGGQAA